MKLTFQYPVYPTRTQEQTLLAWLDHLCELQNSARHDRKVALEVEDRFVTLSDDVGTTHYLTTSEDEKEDNPRWYRKAEGLLRKHSKDFSRKKKGSQRWQKQQHKLALHHERTANKRKDFIGKLVYKLFHHCQKNVLIAEDLSVSNMVKNKHLSKSISDASWGKFFQWCGSIAERDGFHFHQVDPKNTSQTCSACGKKSPKKLSLAIRTFDCRFCGISLDRDHNAAINILLRAVTALRGEQWVTILCEARNTNEARDAGLQNAKQLLLFATSPSL